MGTCDQLAMLAESVMRGVADAPRQTAAAVAAATLRVAAELLMGIAEPSAVEDEVKERMKCIRPVIRARVQAGADGERANVPGRHRRVRNQAEHHAFGTGPGQWRALGRHASDESTTTSEAAATPTQRDVVVPSQHVQPCNDGAAVMAKQDVTMGDEGRDCFGRKGIVLGSLPELPVDQLEKLGQLTLKQAGILTKLGHKDLSLTVQDAELWDDLMVMVDSMAGGNWTGAA